MRYYLLVILILLTIVYSTALSWLPSTPEATTHLDYAVLRDAHDVWGDIGEYEIMTAGGASYPPYKYRVLAPALVAWLGVSWVTFNTVCAVAAGTLFTAYLRRDFSPSSALLGGVLATVTFGMTQTLLFALIEPASYLAFAALLWAARSRKAALFIPIAILAVMVKEVFAFLACGVWCIEAFSIYREAWRNRARAAAGVHGDPTGAWRVSDGSEPR